MYLADFGFLNLPPGYPLPTHLRLRAFTANLPAFVVPAGGSVTFQLLRNGAPLPGFVITYGPGTTGVMRVKSRAHLKPKDTLDLLVTTAALGTAVQVSAMVSGSTGREGRGT